MATPTSESRYDLDNWASATYLGRRLFNYNYRMTGREIRGFALVKTVDMQREPRLTERVYIWEKKGSAAKQLVRIAITETDEWRGAQAELQAQLVHSMRPDIPRGKGKLARLGDVSYAAGPEDAGTIAAVSFTRGNLTISVASVGEEPVDVAAIAKRLDRDLSEPPKKQDLEAKRAIDRSPKPLKVDKDSPTQLKERLPEPVLRNGWLKVMVPDGEIAREGDELVYRSDEKGTKEMLEFVVVQE